MKFISFFILNIAIITHVLAGNKKRKKNNNNNNNRASTYGGNQNKKNSEKSGNENAVGKNEVSADNGLNQNGVESPTSPTKSDDKSDSDGDLKIIDDITSTSELDDAATGGELENNEIKDTADATSSVEVQLPGSENQDGNELSNTPDNLNDEDVTSLNLPKGHEQKTKDKLDGPAIPSNVDGNSLESETDKKKSDPSINSISDQKTIPKEDQNVAEQKKTEDETANLTKQSEVNEKEIPIDTTTLASKPAEATKKTDPTAEITSDTNKDNNKATSDLTAEATEDNNKVATEKGDTPGSNVDHNPKDVTSTGNPSTSETSKVIPPPLPNGPPNEGKQKNNPSEEKKKSSHSKFGKYLLWGLLGVCVVGLTVCMVLLVSSK